MIRGSRRWSRRRILNAEAAGSIPAPGILVRLDFPRPGRQPADHSRSDREMLRVRIPPGPLFVLVTPSRSSLECSPPCQGGDRGFESHRGRRNFVGHVDEFKPRRAGAPLALMRPTSRFDSGAWDFAGGPAPGRVSYARRMGSAPMPAFFTQENRPLVQRQGHPAYTRETGVRFPRGRLAVRSVNAMGGWSNGKTPGLQPGDRGSIPRPVHWFGEELNRQGAKFAKRTRRNARPEMVDE